MFLTALSSSISLIGSVVGNWKIGGVIGICKGYLYWAQSVQLILMYVEEDCDCKLALFIYILRREDIEFEGEFTGMLYMSILCSITNMIV